MVNIATLWFGCIFVFDLPQLHLVLGIVILIRGGN